MLSINDLSDTNIRKLKYWQLAIAVWHFQMGVSIYDNIGYILKKKNEHSPNIIHSVIDDKISTREDTKKWTKEPKHLRHIVIEQGKLINILSRNTHGGWFNNFIRKLREEVPKYKIIRCKIICQEFYTDTMKI